MKNPWMKKNPLLSMWLSGANSMMGSARGRIVAESKRQATAMMSENAKQIVRFWTGALSGGTPTKRRKRR